MQKSKTESTTIQEKPETENKSVEPTRLTRPPFPALESFNATAIVLSYWGFHDRVDSLLAMLGKEAGLYAKLHHEILCSILVEPPRCQPVFNAALVDTQIIDP